MSKKAKLITALLALILFLDQGTKWVVDRTIPLNTTIPVISGFFDLTHIRNTGVAFGILAGRRAAWRSSLLIAFSLIAMAFIALLLWRVSETERMLISSVTLILGGALGNLTDRLLHGEVIDFLDFYWSSLHWPAFNVADSSITIGVFLTLFRLLRLGDNDPFHPKTTQS